ncbi:uxs1 [Symbiodinium sp. CCMP2456]|nr:uxs1 [Symbiodinium sp. CCMP2456]
MASTASRPQAPKVRVMRRRPGGLAVQVVPQTSLLANLECELQWHKASAMGTWSSKIVKCEDGWGVCEVLLGDLASCSDYRLRARFRNAVGWAEDFSAEAFGRTSESAAAPSDLRLAARHPGRVILECSLADPEGAPVTSLEVQLCGQVTWRDIPSTSTAATASWDWDDLGGGPPRVVQVEVALPSDQVSQLRVWSRNIVGRSLLPSPALLCQPSSRPGAVSELHCPRRGLDSLQLDWSTYDPEGAPVHECSVEFWPEGALWPTTQSLTWCGHVRMVHRSGRPL